VSKISFLIGAISRSSAVEVLALERLNSFGRRIFECQTDDESRQTWGDFVDHPVNPQFLSAAMACDLLGFEDAAGVINAFIDGGSVTGLEEKYLTINGDPERIDQVLDLESEFVEAWAIAGLRETRSPGIQRLPENVLREHWNRFCGQKSGGSDAWFYWQALWSAWHLANPAIYFINENPENNAPLFQYGFKWNSRFHNARTEIQKQISTIYAQINELIAIKDRTPEQGERLYSLRNEHKLLQKLHMRAKLFYDWNPCETDAHLAEAIVASEIAQAMEKSSEGSK
jgi:hypothetical protein